MAIDVAAHGGITTISNSKFKIQIIPGDSVGWAADYQGEFYHAAMGDTPYHLTSITDRFGRKGAAECKPDSDGGFNKRRSGGFMHVDWDGDNYVSFKPQTWEAFKGTLFPGALMFMFGHSRTHWRMQAAMDAAGLDLYPIQWGWTYATGMSTPAPVESKLGKVWAGHRYGADILTPALEPIVIAMAPYEDSERRLDAIERTGAGTFNREAARNERGNLPKNLYIQHNFDCTPEQCSQGCPAYDMHGQQVFYNEFRWSYEVAEQVMGMPGLYYQAKPTKAEREFGLDALPDQIQNRLNSGGMSNDPSWAPKPAKNPHPTLKPIELTKTLAAALLPPRDAVSGPRRILCPFGGVGSEAIGALLAGWEHITLVEITEDYIPVCVQRMAAWAELVDQGITDVSQILGQYKQAGLDGVQLSMVDPVQTPLF